MYRRNKNNHIQNNKSTRWYKMKHAPFFKPQPQGNNFRHEQGLQKQLCTLYNKYTKV